MEREITISELLLRISELERRIEELEKGVAGKGYFLEGVPEYVKNYAKDLKLMGDNDE